jgi:hypothetical protein
LRKGNNEKREYSVSVGALGTDATVEGPFVKGGNASYLLNYRYSTLSLLNNLGLVDFGGIPKYQDVSFKVFATTKSLGIFSIFGLGGKSKIREEEFADDDEEQLIERGDFEANMGVVGITQYWSLNEKTFLQNSVSVSQNGSGFEGYEPNAEASLWKVDDVQLDKRSFRAASTLHHKLNARHTLQGGVLYTHHRFEFYDNEYDSRIGEFVTESDITGDAGQYQGFVSWKYRPWENVSIVSGLHIQQVSLNDDVSIEPRASLRWQFAPEQGVTAGFGIHGKMESLPNYYSIIRSEDGSSSMPNQELGFSKARHYVVGYENRLTPNLFLKMEAYYQQLFSIPVENDPNSSYSLINQSEGFTDLALVNEGTGKNVGMELTVERFFADDYYFLATASVFDSKYKVMDGVERNTQFNGRFVGNLLFGKEFKLRSKSSRNKVFGVSARYPPWVHAGLNLEESIAQDRTVLYEEQAYSEKGDNVFIANLALAYRIDNRKVSQELKLDVQNLTNNAAGIAQYYDRSAGRIKTMKQLPLLPVLIYTLHF